MTILSTIVMLSYTVMASVGAVYNQQWFPVTIKTVERYLEKDTINKPALVRPAAKGVLRLTAGNGHAIGPDIKYMPEWRAFGWFTALDRVEWDVEVKKAGAYRVQLEWSVSDEEAGKEFLIKTDRQRVTGSVLPSGSWGTFKTADVGKVELRAGRQKIVFKSNEHFDKGALLDFRELKLTPVK